MFVIKHYSPNTIYMKIFCNTSETICNVELMDIQPRFSTKISQDIEKWNILLSLWTNH